MYKISVITINRNNKAGLERTVKSVLEQTNHCFEYIVIDGDSTDGSKDVMERYAAFFTYAVSEPDRGIYHAMNKGVVHATGEYCLFLNSGDAFADNGVMERLQACPLEADVVTGVTCFDGTDELWRPPSEVSLSFFMEGALSHQASLIKRRVLLDIPYDETMRIVADWKFSVETLVVHRCTFSTIDLLIARYAGGGISADPRFFFRGLKEKNRALRELFPQKTVRDMRRKIMKRRVDALLTRFLGNGYPKGLCEMLCPFFLFYERFRTLMLKRFECGWFIHF